MAEKTSWTTLSHFIKDEKVETCQLVFFQKSEFKFFHSLFIIEFMCKSWWKCWNNLTSNFREGERERGKIYFIYEHKFTQYETF